MRLLTRLFALVLLTLLPVVGIEIYNEIDAQEIRAAEGRDQALRLVRLVAQEQSKAVQGTRQLLTALGKTPVVRDQSIGPCSVFLTDLSGSYPQYSTILSIDLAGNVVCTTGHYAHGMFLGDRSYFKSAIEKRGFVLGEYDADDQTRQKSIYLAQPYYNAAGELAGVIAAGISLDWLNNELARSPLPPKATVSVIDRQGTILARYPASDRFVGTSIPGQGHSYLLTGQEGVQEAPGFDGISRIFSYTPLPGGIPGMTLSIGLDKGELLKASQAMNRRDAIVIAGSCALALLLAGLGARVFISRPISILLGAAEHWKQGELDVRVPFPESRSEFGRLAVAFNSMAAAIDVRRQDLEQRVQERTEAMQQAMQAQRVAEVALYESRKMETVGRLTGGVAHDFNNLLAAVVGNIELARAHLGPRHPELRRLDAAMQSANRGAALIQQLLAFARRQNLRPEVVDLNHYVHGLQDMLQRLLRSDVMVETRLSANAAAVQVDPNQLEAAILNLAINARDAMPKGGILRLATRNIGSADHPGLRGLTGDFVALQVSDTGSGIPPEILEKVFEPFFTTKDIGAGSGLGLSMVQGFVRQSSGSVAIESQIGHGTSVTLFFPRTNKPVKVISPPMEEPIAGEGTILLVDDDDEVRSVTAQLLELSGYHVITACNATEALQHFQDDAGTIDILITDFVLANGLNGLALAAKLREYRPMLPTLLITGYSDVLPDSAKLGDMLVLMKPFAHGVLANAVLQSIRFAGQNNSHVSRSTDVMFRA